MLRFVSLWVIHVVFTYPSFSLIFYISFLALDAFVKTNCRAIAMMFVRLSVRLWRASFSADLSLWLGSLMFWALWHQKTCPHTASRLFPVPPGREVMHWCAKAWYLKNGWSYIGVNYYWVLIGSQIRCVDWHNNGWPWMTFNGSIVHSSAICGSWASCMHLKPQWFVTLPKSQQGSFVLCCVNVQQYRPTFVQSTEHSSQLGV